MSFTDYLKYGNINLLKRPNKDYFKIDDAKTLPNVWTNLESKIVFIFRLEESHKELTKKYNECISG